MLPFCIDESAHLHIVYLAAAGFGDLSHGEESHTTPIPTNGFAQLMALRFDLFSAADS
jgi:hypothetical protein